VMAHSGNDAPPPADPDYCAVQHAGDAAAATKDSTPPSAAGPVGCSGAPACAGSAIPSTTTVVLALDGPADLAEDAGFTGDRSSNATGAPQVAAVPDFTVSPNPAISLKPAPATGAKGGVRWKI
jgi:hypothetical protein